MNFKNIIILSIEILIFFGKSKEDELIQDINFQNSTIKIEYKQGNIEVFASNRTSESIKVYNRNRSLNTLNISSLEWYSIGRPILITSNLSNIISTNTFVWSPNGFHILIDFLSSDQKKHLVNRIGSIYGFKIDSSQINMLRPSRLECFIEFEWDEKMIRINGSAQDFKDYPFKVEFISAYKSFNRICLEMHLIENPDIEINCEIEKFLKRPGKEKFSLTPTEMQTLGITDRLFNGKDSVNITRKQLSMLSDEIFKLFDMEIETSLTKDEFSRKFLNDLKTNEIISDFYHLEFKTGLKWTSPYGIEHLNIEQTITDFENFIEGFIEHSEPEDPKIAPCYSGDHIKIRINPSFNVNSTGSKIFGSRIIEFVKSKADMGHLHYNEIINSMNKYTDEDIIWRFVRYKILPRSIKMAFLQKKDFNKEIVFELKNNFTKKFVYYSVFKRAFKLQTKGNPKEIYTSISNKVINSSLAKIIGVLNNVDSLSECFSYCNERTRCFYVEVDSEKRCRIYDKSGYLGLQESINSTDRRLFNRKRFVKQAKDGFRLTNGSYVKIPIKNLGSDETCWERCLKEVLCSAISFNYTDCFMYKKSSYNFTQDDDFTSILYVDTQTNKD